MDNWDDGRDGEEGEEGEEGGQSWQLAGRTATIFLIDAAREMFDSPKEELEEDPPFTRAIKAIHATLMRKAVSNARDLVGVVFFNTREAKNKFDYHGVHVLLELQRPSAEHVLAMEEIIKMTPVQFDAKLGHMDKASIHDALRTCQSVFLDCEKRQVGCSILLFTCRDDPHSRDEHLRRQAMAKAKDLKESHVAIEILHMGAGFNIDKFYKDLIVDDLNDEDSEEAMHGQRILADPTTRLEQLMQRVSRLENKQRASSKLAFTLAPGVEMSVGVFSVIRKAVKPYKQKLWKNTNQEVKSMTKAFLEETGELLMPSDYEYYHMYSGKKISFTPEQSRSLGNIYEPGMVLLGFKPMNFLKTEYFVKEASFIYPMEGITQGSTKLFSALLERCLAKQVVALVRLVSRGRSSVSFAALIPHPEVLDDTRAQVLPPGFLVHYIPFADNFSNITFDEKTVASDEQVDACKKVVKKLRFEYSPDDFDDPNIETHWEIIRALALNRQSFEDVPDDTVPNHEKMDRLAGPLLREFESLVYPPSYNPLEKLPADSSRSAPAPKRVKVDPSQVDVEAMVKSGKGNSLTVPILKSWLMERGVVVTGKKKAELLQDALDVVG